MCIQIKSQIVFLNVPDMSKADVANDKNVPGCVARKAFLLFYYCLFLVEHVKAPCHGVFHVHKCALNNICLSFKPISVL